MSDPLCVKYPFVRGVGIRQGRDQLVVHVSMEIDQERPVCATLGVL